MRRTSVLAGKFPNHRLWRGRHSRAVCDQRYRRSFSISSGRNFTTAGNFTNNGSLTVGGGTKFTVNGNLTNFAANKLTAAHTKSPDAAVQWCKHRYKCRKITLAARHPRSSIRAGRAPWPARGQRCRRQFHPCWRPKLYDSGKLHKQRWAGCWGRQHVPGKW